jgi:hypothetical protein
MQCNLDLYLAQACYDNIVILFFTYRFMVTYYCSEVKHETIIIRKGQRCNVEVQFIAPGDTNRFFKRAQFIALLQGIMTLASRGGSPHHEHTRGAQCWAAFAPRA